MLSNKEIICPDNLVKIAKKKGSVTAGIVNAGKPLPMHSAMEAVKENIRTIKKLPKIKGVNEILYPGQGMISRYKRNLKKGIVIPKNILEEIKKLNAIK